MQARAWFTALPAAVLKDYEVGDKNNVPPHNNIDQVRHFPAGNGQVLRLKAKTDDKKFIQALEEKEFLLRRFLLSTTMRTAKDAIILLCSGQQSSGSSRLRI